MEKETILAKLHVTMRFSESAKTWLDQANEQNIWFAKEQGTAFFSEFRGTWDRALVESCEPLVHGYFTKLGCPQNMLPRIRVLESYAGSWIMEAAITMFATVGTTYTILQGLSELPEMADGLNKLKDRLKKEFTELTSRKVRETLTGNPHSKALPPLPPKPIIADFIIDARPLLSLTPSKMMSHKIHLSVGVSRDAFTLENLGDEPLRDIRIGLFKGHSQRNQWSYADSFMGTVSLLSGHQTITKPIDDFRSSSGQELTLQEPTDLHVDAWIQDEHGIYLFMFFVAQE
jgi:hypothetical protein